MNSAGSSTGQTGQYRMVPVPPVLAAMLRIHVTAYGTAPDGRLFRGTLGGPISGSVLLTVYSHCIHGHDDLLNQQISQVLEPSA
jgi:hypothetical protein